MKTNNLKSKDYLIYICLFCSFLFHALSYGQVTINTANIHIVRDEYGIPHIYTKTDVEAAYGTAWAQCEDSFNYMQENLAIVKKEYGTIKGKEGALADFIVQFFDLEGFVKNRYSIDIDTKTDTMLSAYVLAINTYAASHKEEIISKNLFPITKQDMLMSYTFNFLAITNALADVARVAQDKMILLKDGGNLVPAGSNAMAYNSAITKDGKTYLVGNSHQPNDSPYNYWEYGIHSEENLDFYGATFSSGGIFPILGSNKNLGWSLTVPYSDYSDVFQLKMHPEKDNYYLFDGTWLPLEEKKAKLRVKWGPFKIPVSRKFYVSKYGPTIKNDSGFFAFRNNGFFNIKAIEQFYKMSCSRNIDEFKDATKIKGLPAINIVYADKKDNILYMHAATMPYRNPDYNWRSILPGDTSKTLWEYSRSYPVDSLPRIQNPSAGYVFNSNNTPLNCTGPSENLNLEDYPKSFGILETNTIRANRFQNLIAQYDSVDFETIRAIKNDLFIDKYHLAARSFMNGNDLPQLLKSTPELANLNEVFLKWNGQMDITNKHAAIISVFAVFYTQYLSSKFAIYDNYVEDEKLIDLLLKTEKFLMKHFGTLEIELGKVQKISRGDKTYPMWGHPNTLANAHFKIDEKAGVLKCNKGDTFIFFAQFDEDGLQSLKRINTFGNSSKENHPHYNDQLETFLEQDLREVKWAKQEVLKTATKVYTPD